MISGKIRNMVLSVLLLVPMVLSAQTDRDYIRQGNKAFRQKQYPQAEVQYRKALSKNNSNPQALYNLGCALMMQNKASEAVKFYQKASGIETNKLRKAKIYHNIGYICQSGKMYSDAIKAYSESLRNNPQDDETRYNLALCKKLQKNENNNKQQQKNDKNKDKDKGKDKNKDQQQPKPDKDNNKNNNKQQQQQQPQMSKDNAEQLLNAAMQQEQQTQQRLNQRQQQQQVRRLEKNW